MLKKKKINIKETAGQVTWSAHHHEQFAFSVSAECNICPTAAAAISFNNWFHIAQTPPSKELFFFHHCSQSLICLT